MMRVDRNILLIGLICSLLCVCNIAYAQEKPETFEQALEQSEKLSEVYESSTAAEQKELKDDWQAVHDRWNNMSEEEKATINKRREERKARWENMSEDEKAEAKKRREQHRDRMRTMSDEQKEALKQQRKERHQEWLNTSAEEKEALKSKRQEMREEWKDLSPQEKEARTEAKKGWRHIFKKDKGTRGK
ncbi:MAG: hypothetical protein JW938_06810 [Candidatus Omnitrophica bacterium]|nr:hypothetical protein [Candidatus Omnitrophota bacterium]